MPQNPKMLPTSPPRDPKRFPKIPQDPPKDPKSKIWVHKGSQRDPTGLPKLNILDIFGVHFGLLGSLGDPMGAFRLKDRFWTDFGNFLVTLGRAFEGQGGTMNSQNGPQVSPQRSQNRCKEWGDAFCKKLCMQMLGGSAMAKCS